MAKRKEEKVSVKKAQLAGLRVGGGRERVRLESGGEFAKREREPFPVVRAEDTGEIFAFFLFPANCCCPPLHPPPTLSLPRGG